MDNNQPTEITLDDVFGKSMETILTPPTNEVKIELDDILKTKPKVEEGESEEGKKPEETVEELQREEPKKTESVWSELIKDHLEDGEWQDAILNIDGKEVKLSELDNVDKKTYKRIQQTFEQKRKELEKEKFLSKEGMSEEDIKLFELKKKGEDISEFLQFEQQYIHPLKDLDLDDPIIQENLVRRNLAHRGDDEEEIEVKIQLYKKNLTLDTKALEAVKVIDDLYKKTIDQKLEERNKEIAEFEAQQKEAKKQAIEKYKEFGLDEKTYKPLLDSAFKIENGLTKTDKLFFNAKTENPELFAKVNYLLNNPKQFEEFFGTKIKSKNALETISIISTIDKKVSNAEQEQTKKDAWDDVPIIVK